MLFSDFKSLIRHFLLMEVTQQIVGGQGGTGSCWRMWNGSFSPGGLLLEAIGVNWVLWCAKFSNCWAV